MSIEYEAKILEIDPSEIAQRILDCGGKKVREGILRRYVYDINKNDPNRWIRLRDTGTGVKLIVKEILHDGIDGTNEIEIAVDDFEKTNQLLNQLGFKAKAYQENFRTSFTLNGAKIEIDQWPLIPPYLEIEADSYEQVVQTAELLGFSKSDLTGENTTKIYAPYGIDLQAIRDLRLSNPVKF